MIGWMFVGVAGVRLGALFGYIGVSLLLLLATAIPVLGDLESEDPSATDELEDAPLTCWLGDGSPGDPIVDFVSEALTESDEEGSGSPECVDPAGSSAASPEAEPEIAMDESQVVSDSETGQDEIEADRLPPVDPELQEPEDPLRDDFERLVPPTSAIPESTPEPTVAPRTPTPTPRPACDPSYPDFCIPPPPPDLDCGDIGRHDFRALAPDPHNLDGDGDGIACAGPDPTRAPSAATATRTPVPATVGPAATPTPTTATPRPACDPSYPDFCIPPPPPDLDCADFPGRHNFRVTGSDPHHLDGNNDGRACT